MCKLMQFSWRTKLLLSFKGVSTDIRILFWLVWEIKVLCETGGINIASILTEGKVSA